VSRAGGRGRAAAGRLAEQPSGGEGAAAGQREELRGKLGATTVPLKFEVFDGALGAFPSPTSIVAAGSSCRCGATWLLTSILDGR